MARKPSKKKLIERLEILTDNREQKPWKYSGYTKFGTLPYGDYTAEYDGQTYWDMIVVERKGLVSELFSAIGSGRDRFERELEKMKDIQFKYVICEFDFMECVRDQPPGILPAQAVYGSIISWHIKFGIPFIFCGNRSNARAFTWKLLYKFVEHKILNF